MLRPRPWIVGILAATVLLGGCGGPTSSSTQAAGSSAPRASEPAPAPAPAAPKELQFQATTLDDTPFSGESLVGRNAVVWFWAPWCAICRKEAPQVTAAARRHAGDVQFVGIPGAAKVPEMKEFVAEQKLDAFPQVADTDGGLWSRFGVTGQPAYAFISADGKVDVVQGSLQEQQLDERVRQLTGA
ncbi:hypothetical protein GCM10012275_36890 [Longimycelium tulufanense]|uniref:Thioredoxin domain-containing protein n=1 Tax=Longimycelium tulufanense TaxID=907463 RepID=A0A8J3FUW8_9PSEU|nr:redoxin family protein [Longimycelium tulufanense]GGM62785.1 hypothetical protein GCM10012275_36890 [Longimycelium tulufanense]